MSIPKGPVWQQLRSDALDAIPAGTTFPYNAPRPLTTWHRTGYYTITSATATRMELSSAADEIGAALMADADHYLDHAAEHHAMITSVGNSETWQSPAWTLVTAYYWAFFSASALSRLLGRTIWYLDKEAANFLHGVAPSSAPSLGPGGYRLRCGPFVSATDRTVQVKKAKGRLHEIVWEELLNHLCDRFASHGDQNADQTEYRLFKTLQFLNGRLGTDWPSAVRNIVNYYPGCAYTEVRRVKATESVRFIRRVAPTSVPNLITSFETEALGVTNINDVNTTPDRFARLVLVLAMLLNAYAHELYTDITARRSFDPRWRKARTGFLRTTSALTQDHLWPCNA